MHGDRTYPIWAFLLSAGLRIGELVALRWPNVDLDARVVRVVEFSSTIGYEVVASAGKSRDAIRTIDLDDQLVAILRDQRKRQAEERLAASHYADSDHVFTRVSGGSYHPQSLSRQLADLSVLAGVPRLTAHGLRHTSATLMQQFRQRRPGEGRSRTAGPCGRHAVHEPLQPRHADDAA